MEAFLVSTGLVALAEIGDKTQLLSIVLAARFRRPVPIIAGILVSTLLNHGAAGAIGAWIGQMLSTRMLGIVAGVSFLAMAAWILVPDKLDAADAEPRDAIRRVAGDILAVEEDLSGTRLDQTGHEVEDGGLARPVGTDQARDATIGKGARHPVHGSLAAERFRKISELDHRITVPSRDRLAARNRSRR